MIENRLLSIDEIITLLDEHFSSLEPSITGLRLKKTVGNKEVLKKFEQSLAIKLPNDFVAFILEYDLGNFEILNVSFASGAPGINYLEHILKGHRHMSYYSPQESLDLSYKFICIAQADYYTFILEIKTSKIYVYGSETPLHNKILVANSLLQLIRLLGTAYYHRKQNTSDQFLQIVKEELASEQIDFWKEIDNW